MRQDTTISAQTAKPQGVESPTGLVFTTTQKSVLIVLALGLLYLRLYLRRRKKDRICSSCGHRNPPHQSNCAQCSAPLFKT